MLKTLMKAQDYLSEEHMLSDEGLMPEILLELLLMYLMAYRVVTKFCRRQLWILHFLIKGLE